MWQKVSFPSSNRTWQLVQGWYWAPYSTETKMTPVLQLLMYLVYSLTIQARYSGSRQRTHILISRNEEGAKKGDLYPPSKDNIWTLHPTVLVTSLCPRVTSSCKRGCESQSGSHIPSKNQGERNGYWVCKPVIQNKIEIISKKNFATMSQVTILGLHGVIKDFRFGGGWPGTCKQRQEMF